MKIKFVILLFLVFFSCKDNLNNSKYRNSAYVFYKEDGKQGFWQKISNVSDFKYKKGKLNYFYDNGIKFGEIEILDSLPNRIEKFFDKETGRLIKTIWKKNDSEYKRVYENGYYKHYHSNKGKIIVEEGLVQNNLEQGLWKRYWNTNGSLKQIINFKDGKLHGKRQNYWENGNIKSISYWDMDKQVGHGIIYYKNGNVEETNDVNDGKIHGISTRYYSNGKLKSKCNYWNEIRRDTCKFYYENGNLEKLEIIKLDTTTAKSSGIIYRYFKSGEIEKILESENNQVNGKAKIYYKNGNLAQEFDVVNNIKNGTIKAYYQTGELNYVGFVKNNLLDGEIKYYDKKGKLFKTVFGKNGIAIDSIMH